MAKITTITNPLTGQPAQVDQLDHTAQQIDDAIARALPGGYYDKWVSQLPGMNLLDNWYFGNPINQRGQTSYTGSGYGIDRWALSVNRPGSFLLHGSDNYSADVKGTFYQRIENKRLIVGAKYTLSVLRGLIASPTLYHGTFTLTTSVGWKTRFDVNGGMFGFYYDSNTSDIQFDLDGEKTIIAVKLELGTQQTLAHQENGVWVLNEIPNYAEELAKCQWYQVELNKEKISVPVLGNAIKTADAGGTWYLTCPIPTTLRANPVFAYTGQAFLNTAEGTFPAKVEFNRMAAGSAIFIVRPGSQPSSATSGIVYFILPDGGVPSALLNANL